MFASYSLKPYRVCPDCGARYHADPATRRRLWLIIFLALLVFGLTMVAALQGAWWWGLVVLGHLAFWSYFAYALGKMTYVEYDR